jgi:hypothetical protein
MNRQPSFVQIATTCGSIRDEGDQQNYNGRALTTIHC